MTSEVFETVKVVAFCVVLLCAVQGATIYAIVKMLTTGKAALFERKPDVPRIFHGGMSER